MEHHVATGCVLTEETNKRHTVDTGVEGDQSTPALRRMLLCKRGPSKEQKEKLKAELFLTEWACMFKQLGKVFTAWQMQITGGGQKSVSQTCCFQLQVVGKEVVGGKYFLTLFFGLFS